MNYPAACGGVLNPSYTIKMWISIKGNLFNTEHITKISRHENVANALSIIAFCDDGRQFILADNLSISDCDALYAEIAEL